jgi:hypothetical protein
VEIRVEARACREWVETSTLTSCVLAVELTPTLTSISGPCDPEKLMGESTKKERAHVWLRIDICTKGLVVLEGGLRDYPGSSRHKQKIGDLRAST